MSDIQFFIIPDLVIIFLVLCLLCSLIYIHRLKRLLKCEKDKRLIPILAFEIEPEGRGIFIKNDGTCAAKDIKVEDLSLTLDYDFKKNLTFKFDAVDMLNPGKKESLVFKIYDKDYAIASEELDNVLGRLSRDSFEIHITYANLENIKFSEVLIKEKDKTLVKEISHRIK